MSMACEMQTVNSQDLTWFGKDFSVKDWVDETDSYTDFRHQY